MPTVHAIDREAARNDNRFSSFILGIVNSTQFQMRRAQAAAAQATETREHLLLFSWFCPGHAFRSHPVI
jgi:hypothetical protein